MLLRGPYIKFDLNPLFCSRDNMQECSFGQNLTFLSTVI